jgi:hypothetical protein
MLNSIIVIPEAECEVLKVNNSGPEVAAILETGKLFQSKPNWTPFTFHYLIAKDQEFAGLLEYEIVDDYVVITNMWINTDLLIPFLTTIYANLSLNFREVRIRDLGIDNIVLIKNGEVNEKVNPLDTSSARLLDFHNLPDGSVRTTLRTFKRRKV